MNVRQLSYFISVGETLSFTRAAKMHEIAQTSMSEQIQEIERQLGTKLFQRSKRSVTLTPAGKTFLAEARRMVAFFEESVRKTRLAASGLEGSLKVGFIGPNERAFLPQLIRDFRRNWPNIELSLTQGTPKVLREALSDNLLDCIFTTTLDPHLSNGFNVQSIYDSPVRAVVSRTHPLAGKSRISLDSLAHEPFVVISNDTFPGAREREMETCARHGFAPHVVSEQNTVESLVMMIEAEIGIGLLPQYYLDAYAGPAVCFIELEDDQAAVECGLLWRTDNDNRSIGLLREALAKII